MTTTMTKRTRQDILNRIDKLKIKPIENAKLIKKGVGEFFEILIS